MEGEARNLQNDFFNSARKARELVHVFLNNGKKLTGRIKSFDKFTLLLETQQGDLMVFKHAVSTVGGARSSNASGAPGGAPADDRRSRDGH